LPHRWPGGHHGGDEPGLHAVRRTPAHGTPRQSDRAKSGARAPGFSLVRSGRILGAPAPASQAKRAMPPSPADRARIDAVFDAVLDLPQHEQMAYLDRAAADDPELRSEVLQLLHAHHRSRGILDSPVADWGGVLLDAGEPPSPPPERIGPWRIV